MRVSKLLLLNGPEPEPTKLLIRPVFCGAGNLAKIAAAWGEILPIGIRLPVNAARPVPLLGSPVAGSKTCPPPPTPEPAAEYSLRLQKPGVELAALVAGLQDDSTVAVGSVNWVLMPLVCRVP